MSIIGRSAVDYGLDKRSGTLLH